MRTIIAGSRDCSHYNDLLKAINTINWVPTVILSGTARGVDRMGERWAMEHNVPIERYPADWNKHGKSAGYKRNHIMAQNADALLALWNFKSKGTKHMIDLAYRYKLLVYVWEVTL